MKTFKRTQQTDTMMKPTNKKLLLLFMSLVLSTAFIACEGPEGPQGPKGEQGPPGPVGPAGAEGSIIHAGEGAPETGLGNPGDFYLDLSAGHLYGPKLTEEWGPPVSLTSAEGTEGPRGPEGPQGPAGEDGNQIYGGNGPPDNGTGSNGDYYLDRDNYDLYGPKTGGEWGAFINLQGPAGEDGQDGEDGNANVTLYTFPSHDFSEDDLFNVADGFFIRGIGVLEVASNTWLIYLQYIYDSGNVGYFLMPGHGQGLERYWSTYAYINDDSLDGIGFGVGLAEGNGEFYNGIHVFRIASNTVEDCTDGTGCKRTDTGGIPADLDVSDYQAVMDYYGLTEDDMVRVSSQ